MAVDQYENEPTTQISPDLWDQYQDALRAVAKWEQHLDLLKLKLKTELGDAHAGMIGDRKVVTYRPINTYSVAGIRRDYEELAQHFEHEVTRTEFDLAAFSAQHPDIADKYRTRQFRVA